MEELLKQQMERIAKMSHDLRNPLNNIYSTLQLLKMYDKENEDKQQHYASAERNIRKLTRIVTHFLEHYAYSEQKKPILPKMFDGRNLIECLCNSVSDLFSQEKLLLSVQIDGNGSVCLDEYLLESAFLNLISNGIKATKDSPCKLTVHASFEEGNLTLSVQDYGDGIPSEHQKDILQPLIQLGNFKEGTGMGLAIVSEFVTLHQGELLIDSEVGKGSTFTLRIPFQTPKPDSVVSLNQPHLDLERIQRIKTELADLL